MAAPKVMSGARAKFGFIEPGQPAEYKGIFNNVSYGLTFDTQPAYVLGAYAPVEIDYTAQEPVQITASGWRVIEHGAHVDGKVPNLMDLLRHEYLTLTILDRQTNKTIAKFKNVRPTGYSTTLSARNLEEVTVTFIAIKVDDESTENEEDPSATQGLP